MFFSVECRETLKNGGMSDAREIQAEISARWRKIKGTSSSRRFQKMQADDVIRFNREVLEQEQDDSFPPSIAESKIKKKKTQSSKSLVDDAMFDRSLSQHQQDVVKPKNESQEPITEKDRVIARLKLKRKMSVENDKKLNDDDVDEKKKETLVGRLKVDRKKKKKKRWDSGASLIIKNSNESFVEKKELAHESPSPSPSPNPSPSKDMNASNTAIQNVLESLGNNIKNNSDSQASCNDENELSSDEVSSSNETLFDVTKFTTPIPVKPKFHRRPSVSPYLPSSQKNYQTTQLRRREIFNEDDDVEDNVTTPKDNVDFIEDEAWILSHLPPRVRREGTCHERECLHHLCIMSFSLSFLYFLNTSNRYDVCEQIFDVFIFVYNVTYLRRKVFKRNQWFVKFVKN